MEQTMKRTILILTAAAVATGSLAFQAQARGDGIRFDLTEMDADGNGEITQAEVSAFQEARFNEADTDGDGNLSEAEILASFENRTDRELGARAERRIAHMIDHLDANNDGLISLEEQQARDRSGRMFDRVDSNDDGTLSAEEIETAQTMAEKRGKRGGKDGGKGKNGDRAKDRR